ncbi:hypothetical protein MKQ68_25105 [Chitinophaga horti]|uniref:GAF domain-containing protein n=1 Tax=Chitinophaga horti TaxID=2920382 RepID=A0ABY6J145_9BACT|nr:hypothetical protein [Chitinophaga horti]UYQ93365.1 hypothetical protein MKQ68_25105 [Chitinophaga horti]
MKTLTAHPTLFKDDLLVDTQVSFGPFLRFLKDKVVSSSGATASFYQLIIDKFESNPALSGPIDIKAESEKYRDYFDLVISTVFPITNNEKKDIYAIGMPYRFMLFHYSQMFHDTFSVKGEELRAVPAGMSLDKVKKDKLVWLYKLILERLYDFPVKQENEMVHAIVNPETGVKRYVKVFIDSRFVDIKVKGELPVFDCGEACKMAIKQRSISRLQELLPLELFQLEGFVVWSVQDITEQEVMAGIKNMVLDLRAGNEEENYLQLQDYLQSLLSIKDVNVNVIPFLKVNNKWVVEECSCNSSILMGNARNESERQSLYLQLLEHLTQNKEPLVLSKVTRDVAQVYGFMKYLPLNGINSYILLPVHHENDMLGVLEISSATPEVLDYDVMMQLTPVYPSIALLLRRSRQIANERIGEVIKEKFTALQPAVEWKFTEAAWDYLANDAKEIGNIRFEGVQPLYGAIDIRNSSIERGTAIREDLREQLQLIAQTFVDINGQIKLPLLEELQYKNNVLLNSIGDTLFAEDEVRINDFLDQEIAPTLQHLYEGYPTLKEVLESYFSKVDKESGHVFHHRREYEDSLGQINTVVNAYLENEREAVQESFPCYFEKYRTDGVEYNIYIGQSIAPDKKFDLLYLRNLRLWQLTSMAAIARETHKLSPTLKVPLQTTQLILVHSNPIEISFRKDERRFDVEGAYNIRYEIMKKRIDKVRIRETKQRLTQPGTIALVYSYAREADEYRKYIEFLQNKNILKPGIEMLELEELQGISGLKAMRVEINFE